MRRKMGRGPPYKHDYVDYDDGDGDDDAQADDDDQVDGALTTAGSAQL